MAKAFRPPPKWTISQWADNRRVLSSEASSEPGKWRTARAEYQREMMDAASNPRVHTIVFKTSAQIGKTEILLNILGFFIDFDPAPILILQPTQDPMAKDFARDRLNPMIRDCPTLKKKVKGDRAKGSADTLLHKSFPGGHCTIVGANSPSALASRPIRILLCDEVDRYPASAGKEGDPVKLASKRTQNFLNRKKFFCSTPTIKGFSRIDGLYESGDQRRPQVACPHCGEFHELEFENVVYEEANPAGAVWGCPECGETYTDTQRMKALKVIRWVATKPFDGIASFWINALYSPWTPLKEVVQEYLDSKDDPETYKTFVNTYLGLAYDDEGLSVDEHVLMQRREDWGEALPDGVLRLTAGVDVQPDRLELELVGWGRREESWSIEHMVFYGDPETPEGHEDSPWTALMDYWHEVRLDRWGHEHRIHTMGIDSGGQNTQAVYHFCKGKKSKRIFAFKGRGGEDVAVVSSPNKKKSGRKRRGVDLFTIGVDQAKATIYRRLRKAEPGPGYCHFPKGRELEYFEQLTAEKAVTKSLNGFAKRVWEKPEGRRNEALDCRVYAYAAMILSAPVWSKISERLEGQRTGKPMFELVRDETVAKPVEERKPVEPAKRKRTPEEVEDLKRQVLAMLARRSSEKTSKGKRATKPHTSKPKPHRKKSVGFVRRW